jgi:hypothetical protein
VGDAAELGVDFHRHVTEILVKTALVAELGGLKALRDDGLCVV